MSSNKSYIGIPNSWINATIDDIVSKNNNSVKRGPFGSSIKKEFFVPKGYKVYEQKNVIYNDFTLGNYFIDEKKFKELEDFELKSGDIVISCSGTIGKIAITPNDLPRGVINQALLKISLDDSIINKKYFLYLFNSHDFQDKITSRGSAMLNLTSVKDLKKILIPLPPFNEQKRIVSKLEELFTKLDAGIEYLKKTQILLKQYRQSVLKYAFEGKLTEKWREKNRERIESATILLEKIKKHSKIHPKKDLRNKFNTLNSGLWLWAKLSELVLDYKNDIVDGPFGSNLHASEYVEKGIPIVRLQNIDRNRFVNKNIKFITNKKAQFLNRHNCKNQDILITKLGDPLGKACIVPATIPNGIVVADVVRMRINHPYILNSYVSYAINSPQVIDQFPRPKGSTRPRINLNHIRDIEIPIAPLIEQEVIIKKIEYLSSLLENIEKSIQENLLKSGNFRNMILKYAFEGKLVPQDPNDEPASILLEKIRQEKSPEKHKHESHKKIKDKQQSKQTRLQF